MLRRIDSERRTRALSGWLLVALATFAVACTTCAREDAPPAGAPTEVAHGRMDRPALNPEGAGGEQSERTWAYASSAVGRTEVVVRLPPRRRDAGAGSREERFPVLIALHGRGEAFKGPARGARGWVDDYLLPRAAARLAAPPLTSEDLEGFVDENRLAALNRALEERPYRGLIVVCPYTPDILAGERAFAAAAPFADFVIQELLPRVYRETPALGTARATGIDGVSLGGRAALLVGLEHPGAFGAVAGMQAAFDAGEVEHFAALAKNARSRNPALSLRLLTSEGDFFLGANRALAAELTESGAPNPLLVVSGPHNYDFNRGPGVIEMLMYHDRVLRGDPPP